MSGIMMSSEQLDALDHFTAFRSIIDLLAHAEKSVVGVLFANVALEMAKTDPVLFVRKANEVIGRAQAVGKESSEEVAARAALVEMRKRGEPAVPCIKRIREVTGWGLREAKDFYDAETSAIRPVAPAATPVPVGFDAADLKHVMASIGVKKAMSSINSEGATFS